MITDYLSFLWHGSISGMTLPGLSGSLLILILGNYNLLLVDCVNALFFTLKDVFSGAGWGLHDPERRRLLGVFIYFTLGSSVGLIVFSKLLEQLMTLQKHYHFHPRRLYSWFPRCRVALDGKNH